MIYPGSVGPCNSTVWKGDLCGWMEPFLVPRGPVTTCGWPRYPGEWWAPWGTEVSEPPLAIKPPDHVGAKAFLTIGGGSIPAGGAVTCHCVIQRGRAANASKHRWSESGSSRWGETEDVCVLLRPRLNSEFLI